MKSPRGLIRYRPNKGRFSQSIRLWQGLPTAPYVVVRFPDRAARPHRVSIFRLTLWFSTRPPLTNPTMGRHCIRAATTVYYLTYSIGEWLPVYVFPTKL